MTLQAGEWALEYSPATRSTRGMTPKSFAAISTPRTSPVDILILLFFHEDTANAKTFLMSEKCPLEEFYTLVLCECTRCSLQLVAWRRRGHITAENYNYTSTSLQLVISFQIVRSNHDTEIFNLFCRQRSSRTSAQLSQITHYMQHCYGTIRFIIYNRRELAQM